MIPHIVQTNDIVWHGAEKGRRTPVAPGQACPELFYSWRRRHRVAFAWMRLHDRRTSPTDGDAVRRRKPNRQAGLPLSQRQQDVARLVGQGLTNVEIAQKLFISRRTVETHVAHIKQKLALDTRYQIMAWVINGSLDGTRDASRPERASSLMPDSDDDGSMRRPR